MAIRDSESIEESQGTSLRCRRIAEALKGVVGQIITQELSDPRLGFVTVTGVKVSRDLKQAMVKVSVLGEQSGRRKTLAALSHAAGFIKRRCSDELGLRFTPNMKFEFDEGIDKSIRVSELLYSGEEVPPEGKLPPFEADPE
jgi:ribosome-binding factor A